ncbi:MAG: Flp pilus assembly protein CpaB [Planctomycetaceae bacterium]
MKPKTVILLAVAVGSGLLAMLGVQQAMSGAQAEEEEKVNVLVALDNIQIGVELTTENTTFREMPISAIGEDPVTKPEDFEKRSSMFALAAGDIVRKSKLSKKFAYGKSTQIPDGMRVVSIPVDDTGSHSGLLSAGDRVDVMVTFTQRDRGGRALPKTMTLLEYIEIFATDDKTAREGGEADSKGKTGTCRWC